MKTLLAAVVGGVIGWLLCRHSHDKTQDVQIPKNPDDPMNYPNAEKAPEMTPGVPGGDQEAIAEEAGSTGLPAGEVNYETDQIIERDVGTQTKQAGADAIKATSGRDKSAPFAPRPSIGSMAAFTNAFPAAPTDPGAVPSDTPIE